MSYAVKILKTGYCESIDARTVRADCTITLVTGPRRILVDTGGPRDREFLVDALAGEGLKPEDIEVVVCTHGHSDHAGNNNLFPDALLICGFDICRGDVYTIHGFGRGLPYPLDKGAQVVPTPGHTGEDVSVFVETTEGMVAIVGDLFENDHDEKVWRSTSRFPKLQEVNRSKVLREATAIIPGHGGIFTIPYL